MTKEGSGSNTVDAVYDYLVARGGANISQMKRDLGTDASSIKTSLAKLENEGRIKQHFIRIFQPLSLREAMRKSTEGTITRSARLNNVYTDKRRFEAVLDFPPTPPRTIPVRMPHLAREKYAQQMRDALAKQQRAKIRQMEVKKKSRQL